MAETVKRLLEFPSGKLLTALVSLSAVRAFMIFLLIIFVFLLGTFQINDSDFWWHLSTGKYISETARIPKTDPFTFTSEERSWINHEWLFGFLIYQLYNLVGIPGLILLKTLILIASFLFLFFLLLKRIKNYPLSYLIVLMAAILAHKRFYLRPELLTFFFSIVLLYLIASFKKKRKRSLFFLPVMFCLWANLHSGVIFGLYIMLVFIISESVTIIGQDRLALPLRSFSFLVWISFLSFLATFLNPNFYQQLLYPFYVYDTEKKILRHNIEWQPPGFNANFWLFWSVLGLLFFVLLITYKKVRLFDLFIALPFSFLALRSQRSIALFALMIAPILAWHLKAACVSLSEKWQGTFLRNNRRESVLSILLFLLLSALYLKGFLLYDRPFAFGMGIREGMPEGAADFVKEQDLKGPMYNAHEFGGYLIWRFYPERKVFIDGRNHLHRNLFAAMNQAMEDKDTWKEFLSRYNIQFAILSYPKKLPDLWDRFSSDPSRLFSTEDWGLAYWDNWAMVYLNRHNERNRRILEKMEYKIVRPSEMRLQYLHSFLKDPHLSQRIIEELNRNIAEHPFCFRAHNILGMVYSRMGHFEKALEHYKRAISLRPRFAPYHYNLAVCYLKDGQYEKAKKELILTKRLERNVAKTKWLLYQLRQYGY